MRVFVVAVSISLVASFCGASWASADDKIADVVRALPLFAASGRSLTLGSAVDEHERVTTSSVGGGELVFIDGTKLALGPSASLNLDKSLMRGGNKFSTLGITTLRGAFRWISGSSGSSAYALSTPYGTIGIRGTVLDITVRDGRAYVALLSGRARVCGNGGCQILSSSCDYVELSGKISKTKKISAGFRSRKDAARIFPYLANPGRLSSRFNVGGSNCLSTSFAYTETPSRVQAFVSPPPPPPPPPPPNENCSDHHGNRNGHGEHGHESHGHGHR